MDCNIKKSLIKCADLASAMTQSIVDRGYSPGELVLAASLCVANGIHAVGGDMATEWDRLKEVILEFDKHVKEEIRKCATDATAQRN